MDNQKEEKPFISVIIPTRRKSEILNHCLDSLLHQDYPGDRYEIILVPESKLILEESERIRIIYNTTYAQSRNMAAKIARGELFAYVDDDCVVPTDWLSKAVKYFKDSKVGLIGGPALPPKNEIELRYRIGGYLLGSPFVTAFGSSRYRFISYTYEAKEHDLLTANNFVRREAFDAVAGFDMEISASEETDLYFRLRDKGYKLLYVPEIFVWHRSRPIFWPIINKIFCYATGRGILMAKKPRTIRFIYLIPTICIVGLVALLMLSFVFQDAWRVLLIVFAAYFISDGINALHIFFKQEKNLWVLWGSLPTTPFIHLSYGLGILYGFYTYHTSHRKKELRLDGKY